MLNIDTNINNKELTVVLNGRLDTVSAPVLEGKLKTAIDSIESLVFDIKGLEYISSAGLRVLLTAQKVMNKQGKMVVKGANEVIMDIFEVTGFSDILTLE